MSMFDRAFSATETHLKRSSIVEMNVPSLFSSYLTWVTTCLSDLVVSTEREGGRSTLSGEIAFATASACCSLSYVKKSLASRVNSFEILSYELVHESDKV